MIALCVYCRKAKGNITCVTLNKAKIRIYPEGQEGLFRVILITGIGLESH